LVGLPIRQWMEHNYMAAQVFRRDAPDIIAQSVLLHQPSNPQTSLNVIWSAHGLGTIITSAYEAA